MDNKIIKNLEKEIEYLRKEIDTKNEMINTLITNKNENIKNTDQNPHVWDFYEKSDDNISYSDTVSSCETCKSSTTSELIQNKKPKAVKTARYHHI